MSAETIYMPPLAVQLTWRDDRLASIFLDFAPEEALPTAVDSLSPRGQIFARGLAEYLSGRATDFGLDPERDLPMDEMSDFSRDILLALFRAVRFGSTTTYGALARLAGRPNAARAVGRTMASNRWPLLIPCHRVLGASGALTGFTGAGLPMKKLLLGIEGADFREK